ncbi:EVE domain-containing protein [Magnetovibrio sp. PR-2]|uniref:EVE domain-containing protein n=1 Tax=Magnetovibrio sp. PR-2 TaxID=3120356 RepID=UPI002FCE3CF0
MRKWLVKSEPGCWSWADHVKAGTAQWDGVRNHQAANYMKDMAIGHLAFFYHSVNEKSVVGILEVMKEAYIDPTDAKGKFVCVDFKARERVKIPVSLADIKANPQLENMTLLRQSRLSVMPVADDEWDEILTMAGGLET